MSTPIAQLRAFSTVFLQVMVGDSINFESTANELGMHSIEIKRPGDKNFSSLIKKIAQEVLGTTITFDKPGRYSVRSVCTDPATGVKAVSRWVEVDAIETDGPDSSSSSQITNVSVLGAIGDSTFTDTGFGDPLAGVPAQLVAFSGREVTLVANHAAQGTTTRDWADTNPGSMLANARDDFVAKGVQAVINGIGTNDPRFDRTITVDEFKANQKKIADFLLEKDIITILNYPVIPLLGAGNNVWPQASIDLAFTYRPAIDSLCNGTTILQGDKLLSDYLRNNPHCFQGGVPVWTTPLIGGFHQSKEGKEATERSVAMGVEYALNPKARNPIVSILPPLKNPDGTINFNNRNKWFDDRSQAAWRERIGLTFEQVHPGNPPDTRKLLHQYVDNYDNVMRDLVGQGQPITYDPDLGHPGQIKTMTCANPVYPWNACLAHPGVHPGNGNFRKGLPRAATDVLAPENNSAGYNYGPDGTTIISGKGDGFTPPETFMKAERQKWVAIDKAGKYFSQRDAGDDWSVYGHILYVPEDWANFCGILRAGSAAVYNLCVAFSPRSQGGPWIKNDTDASDEGLETFLYWRMFEKGDPFGAVHEGNVRDGVSDSTVVKVLGKPANEPVCMYRTPYIVCNEAWAFDKTGMHTTLIGPTTRDGDQYPFPVRLLKQGEVPICNTITGMNEVGFVAVHDTINNVAKVIAFAMQGGGLRGHSLPYKGFSSEGSWQDFMRVGEYVLPFQLPSAILAGTDAQLHAAPDPSTINLSDPGYRKTYGEKNADNAGQYLSFPHRMWCCVVSKEENDGVIIDFSDWMGFVNSQYLTPDQADWQKVADAHAAGTFPPNWMDQRPDLAPKEQLRFEIDRPVCMLASGYMGRWFGDSWSDQHKLLIFCEDGTVRAFNMSWYQDPFDWTGYAQWKPDALSGGSFFVERGITSACWARFDETYDLVADTGVMTNTGADHANRNPSGFGHLLYVATPRKIHAVVCRWDQGEYKQKAAIFRTLEDSRLGDIVHISMDDRFKILHAADFKGKKVASFIIDGVGLSAVTDSDGTVIYPGFYWPSDPNDPKQPFGFGGELIVPGGARMSYWGNIN